MKLSTILSASALLATSLASTAPVKHAVADLLARAIDPATMDPTKLSVLSVLKTAMPSTTTGTGTDINLPTGTAAPQWYKDLPADVMVLLAQMYPAAAAASETAVTGSASQTTLTRTLELGPSATKAANGSLATGGSSDAQGSANATLPTSLPSPTQSASISTGAKIKVGTGKWSLAMGVGLAAVFCFFA